LPCDCFDADQIGIAKRANPVGFQFSRQIVVTQPTAIIEQRIHQSRAGVLEGVNQRELVGRAANEEQPQPFSSAGFESRRQCGGLGEIHPADAHPETG
jgi:hypothetical protein